MAFTKALIVDDSKLARVTLKKKLESLGLDVIVAESAEQAFQALEANGIDIIFMDHLMPEMDGFEATQQLREQGLQLPIIMCTGKEHDSYLEEALAIGANYILSKPPVDEDLAAVLSMSFAAPVSGDEVMTVDDFDLSALEKAIEDTVFDEPVPVVKASVEPVIEEQLFSDDMDLSWLNQEKEVALDHQNDSQNNEALVAEPVFAEPQIDSLQQQGLSEQAVQALIEAYAAESTAQLQNEITNLQETLASLSSASSTQSAFDEESLQLFMQQYSEQNQSSAIAELTANIAALEEKLASLADAPSSVEDSATLDKQELEMLIQSSIDTSRAVIVEELGQNIRQLQQQLDEMPIASSSGEGERELLVHVEEILRPRLIEIKSNLLDDIENKMQKEKERDFDELLELRLNVLLGERLADFNQRIKLLEESQDAAIPTMTVENVASHIGDEQAQIERFRQSEKLTRHLDQLIEENALFAKRIQQIRQLSIAAVTAAGASLVVSVISHLIA